MPKLSGDEAIAYFRDRPIVPVETVRNDVHAATIRKLQIDGCLLTDNLEGVEHFVFAEKRMDDKEYIPDNPEMMAYLIEIKKLQLEIDRTDASLKRDLAEFNFKTEAVTQQFTTERLRIETDGRIETEKLFNDADQRRLEAQQISQRIFADIFINTAQVLGGVATAAMPLIGQSRD